MRWWLRLVVTLILAPVLWRLGAAYVVAAETSATWSDLARQSVGVLASVYLTFTLPALVLCGAILAAADVALHKLGLDLLTVLVSPLLACLVVALILRFAPHPPIQNADAVVVLAIVYGLVWGLTIREPRARGPVRRMTTADPPGAGTTEAR